MSKYMDRFFFMANIEHVLKSSVFRHGMKHFHMRMYPYIITC